VSWPVVVLGPDDHHREPDIPPGVSVLRAGRRRFGDGEQLVGLQPADAATVRGLPVLVVHTTSPPQDLRMVSLLQLAEAVTGAGAGPVTCFIPYLCYQRQDRRTAHGAPVSALIMLRALASLGVRAVLTVDRHSNVPPDVGLPVVDLSSAGLVADFVRGSGRHPEVVVAPDAGGASRAQRVAERLRLPFAVLGKSKSQRRGTFYRALPPDLKGRHCLVVEDLCSTGTTLRPLAATLAPAVREITVFVTHALHGYDALRSACPSVSAVGYSDTCGDPKAPVHVLPLALAAEDQARHIR
jgi:ribose-phosphate pyrophosphokinase